MTLLRAPALSEANPIIGRSALGMLAASREAERRDSWRTRNRRPQTELIGELEHGNHWLQIEEPEELDSDSARFQDRLKFVRPPARSTDAATGSIQRFDRMKD